MAKDTQNYCRLYLVRHGETDWNAQGKIQGQTELSLNETGRIQAYNLAKDLKNIKFEKVFSSTSIRARQTAEILALEKKLAIETTEALKERRYGRLEGQHKDLFKKLDLMMDILSEEEKFKFKAYLEMESDEEVVSRVLTFLREIAVAYIGKDILVATHGGLMRALLKHLGMGIKRGTISNGAVVLLFSDGVDFIIKETKGILL